MKCSLITLAFVIFWHISPAQTIQEVKKLNKSNVYAVYTSLNGKLYFNYGGNLWVSNGTDTGTYEIQHMADHQTDKIENIAVLGGQLLLIAYDSLLGQQLWVSNGTPGGTNILLSSGVKGRSLEQLNGHIYFLADDNIHGVEIWRTDGTLQGTTMFMDINPAPNEGILTGGPYEVLSNNGLLFFTGYDSTHESEFWISDGTIQGTKMVTDLLTGAGSWPHTWRKFGNKVLFAACGDVAGNSIFITDGTAANTHALCPGREINDLVVNNGKAFYMVQDTLMVSDGTVQGTAKLGNIYRDYRSNNNPHRSVFLSALGNRVYWDGCKRGPNNSFIDCGLWGTDGTPVGTILIKEFQSTPFIGPAHLTNFGDKIYFRGVETKEGKPEIWRTDGTYSGTIKVNFPQLKVSHPSILVQNFFIDGNFMVNGTTMYFLNNARKNTETDLFKINMWPDNIEEIVEGNNISIYPNPAQTELTISARDITSVRITNIAGIVVHKEEVPGENVVINTCNWTPGIYIATVHTVNGQAIHQKIIKE